MNKFATNWEKIPSVRCFSFEWKIKMILISFSFHLPEYWMLSILRILSAMLHCKMRHILSQSKANQFFIFFLLIFLHIFGHLNAFSGNRRQYHNHCPFPIQCVNFWVSRYFYNPVYDYWICRYIAFHYNKFSYSLKRIEQDFECDTIWIFIYTNWGDPIIIYSYSLSTVIWLQVL